LQEINDRVDFLFGQNPVSSERRHHGQRIALGFVVENCDQFVAGGVLALDVGQFRTDGAGILAALDDMAGQAIALAAIEGELLPLGNSRLGAGRTREGSAGQQRQNGRGFPQEGGDQGRFPDVMSMIPMEYSGSKAQRLSDGNVNNRRGSMGVHCSRVARGIAGLLRRRANDSGRIFATRAATV